MSVQFPQTDYPRGSLPRGGGDIWDTPQASVVLADDMFVAAAPSGITLTGNNVASTATSTQGAVGQTHVSGGNACRQDTTATQAAIVQTHVVSGSSARQDTTSSSSAGVSQSHILVGAGVAVDHIAAASAIVQTHILSGANCASFIEDGLALGIVTHPSVQFMQNTYDAQCL